MDLQLKHPPDREPLPLNTAGPPCGLLWPTDKDPSLPGECRALGEATGQDNGRRAVVSGPAPAEELAATLALTFPFWDQQVMAHL